MKAQALHLLVHDDQTSVGCVSQDSRCSASLAKLSKLHISSASRSLLDHLKHESAPVPEQVIPRSNPRKDLVHDPYPRRVSWHKRSRLSEDGYDRSLPEQR